MPDVTWEDVRRILVSAVRGGIRDISTTVIRCPSCRLHGLDSILRFQPSVQRNNVPDLSPLYRRILEFKVAHRLDPRITWKLLKGALFSAGSLGAPVDD